MFMYSVQVAVLRTYTHSIFNKTEPSRGSNSPHLIALRDSAPTIQIHPASLGMQTACQIWPYVYRLN